MRRHRFSDGERGGEPRRFNAEKVDQAGHAMDYRTVDLEISEAAAWPRQFRPDAGMGGL